MVNAPRRPLPSELRRVHDFVQRLVDETYAFVWPSGAPAIDATDWTQGWIIERDARVVAVMLTGGEWLDDLWIDQSCRGIGLGSALLAQAEAEIAARGIDLARLRVVRGNDAAIAFYRRRNWRLAREYRHERLPIDILELEKKLIA